jgi:pyruvate formate lyase activating enzyme
MDSSLHKEYTGQGNERIKENLLKIAKKIEEEKIDAELWIRIPLIPNITATKENISSLLTFIKENLSGAVSRIEFCAFNKACANKYERLGINWELFDYPLISAEETEEIRKMALNMGIDGEKLVISGITKQ